MSRATRTTNPLPFQDLEPHRFEDLVRQLAYGFRNWKALEATGRLGQDEGVDIRGIESAAESTQPPPTTAPEEENEPISTREEREWRIQVKRYKTLSASALRTIVHEAVPDKSQPPYGLIVAIACDVSAAAMKALRLEVAKVGISEVHLWSRAHLEDLLFRPENDHLLFAYFGISLNVRRRTNTQRLRDNVILKRKLMKAFGIASMRDATMLRNSILVRDALDQSYPNGVETTAWPNIPPWHFAEPRQFDIQGLVISRLSYLGRCTDDGWDACLATQHSTCIPDNDFV